MLNDVFNKVFIAWQLSNNAFPSTRPGEIQLRSAKI